MLVLGKVLYVRICSQYEIRSSAECEVSRMFSFRRRRVSDPFDPQSSSYINSAVCIIRAQFIIKYFEISVISCRIYNVHNSGECRRCNARGRQSAGLVRWSGKCPVSSRYTSHVTYDLRQTGSRIDFPSTLRGTARSYCDHTRCSAEINCQSQPSGLARLHIQPKRIVYLAA